MANVNDEYFKGHYKDIWKSIVPSNLTSKEVEFMETYFHLTSHSRVLDLMCGYGRHSLALAEKGFTVVAIDNLEEYIVELQQQSAARHLPITPYPVSIVDFSFEEGFDLAICMGNSLNFFNNRDVTQILKNTFKAIKSGGQILINTWSLIEIAVLQFEKKSESFVNGIKLENQSEFLFHPTRIETTSIMTGSDGRSEVKYAVDYILSVSEFENILMDAGFSNIKFFSIPGKKKFSLGDPRAYIVGDKS